MVRRCALFVQSNEGNKSILWPQAIKLTVCSNFSGQNVHSGEFYCFVYYVGLQQNNSTQSDFFLCFFDFGICYREVKHSQSCRRKGQLGGASCSYLFAADPVAPSWRKLQISQQNRIQQMFCSRYYTWMRYFYTWAKLLVALWVAWVQILAPGPSSKKKKIKVSLQGYECTFAPSTLQGFFFPYLCTIEALMYLCSPMSRLTVSCQTRVWFLLRASELLVLNFWTPHVKTGRVAPLWLNLQTSYINYTPAFFPLHTTIRCSSRWESIRCMLVFQLVSLHSLRTEINNWL